jgi:hypothetical protein
MREPSAGAWLWALLGALAGVLVGVGVTIVVTVSDGSVRPWLVIGLAGAAGALTGAVSWVWHGPQGLHAAERPMSAMAGPAFTDDRKRGGLGQLQWRLDQALRDPDRFESTVRRPLADIARHRLRMRHGVDFDRDPDRARDLVGDELWSMMTGPGRSRRDLRTVRSWVGTIERL